MAHVIADFEVDTTTSVHICTPTSGGEVYPLFYPIGTHTKDWPPAVKCELDLVEVPRPAVDEPEYEADAVEIVPGIGWWIAEFADVAEGDYILTAIHHKDRYDVDIRVSVDGGDAGWDCIIIIDPPDDGLLKRCRVRRNIQADPARMALRVLVAGSELPSLRVGGPTRRRNRLVTGCRLGTMPGDVVNGAKRWFATFSDVPLGSYALEVQLSDESRETVNVMISRLK